MGDSKFQKDRESLGAVMRAEWDRRVRHDYRFWMSDGVVDDDAMWKTGERDFAILTRGLGSTTKTQTALELGCGVGRILRAAAAQFSRVIGVDVSTEALTRARELVGKLPNVELVQTNGYDLSAIQTGTVDVAYSFAALGSMPVKIAAGYLTELGRVIRPGGIARLQIYLGREQETAEEDSIAIRSFDRNRFADAAASAGFDLDWIEELQLPFEISDHDAGLVAQVVSLKRSSRVSADQNEVLQRLVQKPETSVGPAWRGSRTECLMAIFRADQHLSAGQVVAAREALRYASTHYADTDADVQELIKKTEAEIAQRERETVSVTVSQSNGIFSGEIYERNIRALRERFPEVVKTLESLKQIPEVTVVRGATGLPVIELRGNALDNTEKPERGGEMWAERALNNPLAQSATDLVVAGFAGGYHLGALLQKANARVHVIEPDPQILRAALGVRDCTSLINALSSLHLSVPDFKRYQETQPALQQAVSLSHPVTQILFRDAVEELRRGISAKRAFGELRPSIGVVGPLYGGSQPIGAYTARALKELGQRTQYFDLACFHDAYSKFGAFVRERARIDSLQSYYVEIMSQLVLEAVTERPIDILVCVAQAPISARVLTELRQRGIITVMWFVEDCRRFLTWQSISKYFDYMFVIQKDNVPALVEGAGAGRAIYLPTACDPIIHRPMEISAEERKRWGSDISFVGAGYNNRQQMFATLAQRDFKIWGTEWPTVMPFSKLVQEGARRIDPAEYVKIFNSSAINLNLHSSMERDGVEPNGDFINPRTFELAGCGAFQLLDTRTLLPELFTVGEELITFTNRQEMEDGIDYYLAHPVERQAIADRSRAKVLAEHTYVHRIQEMLSHIYADRYDELKSRLDRNPWQATLRAAESQEELSKRLKVAFERGDEPTLDSLVADIQLGKGSLSETEQKLLFLHHIKKQIVYINELRQGKST